ncbi:MAG: molybdenum cofactor guanylyltransferase [Ferruginibacter sp.]
MKNQLPVKNSEKVHGLYGLIVCGGKSSRMGTDKSMLVYYDIPHCHHLYEMLEPFCEKVFISCNHEQEKNIDKRYATITDLPAFNNTGPMASLLSAFTEFKNKDFLVIGCDYPFLNSIDIGNFLSSFKSTDLAAAFYNSPAALYEPLLAYYNKTSSALLFEMYNNKEYSLQHFLKKNNAIKFFPSNIESIKSIDTKEEFLEAKTLITSTGH